MGLSPDVAMALTIDQFAAWQRGWMQARGVSAGLDREQVAEIREAMRNHG